MVVNYALFVPTMIIMMACDDDDDDDVYYMTLSLLLQHFYLHTESDRYCAIYYSKLLHLQKPHKRTNTHVTTKVASSIMAVGCAPVHCCKFISI